MAKQLTDLNELFSNELSDNDYMLVRDKSSNTDKKITVEAVKLAFEASLGLLAGKDTITGADIDNDSIPISKVDFIDTDPVSQYVLAIGDIQIIAGATNASLSGTTVTFKQPFGSTPAIVVTTRDPNEQNGWFYDVGTTFVRLKQKYSGASLQVNWVAIGARGSW